MRLNLIDTKNGRILNSNRLRPFSLQLARDETIWSTKTKLCCCCCFESLFRPPCLHTRSFEKTRAHNESLNFTLSLSKKGHLSSRGWRRFWSALSWAPRHRPNHELRYRCRPKSHLARHLVRRRERHRVRRQSSPPKGRQKEYGRVFRPSSLRVIRRPSRRTKWAHPPLLKVTRHRKMQVIMGISHLKLRDVDIPRNRPPFFLSFNPIFHDSFIPSWDTTGISVKSSVRRIATKFRRYDEDGKVRRRWRLHTEAGLLRGRWF